MVQSVRNECKYVISALDFYKIRRELCAGLSPDPHMNAYGYYRVRSTYFDTPEDRSVRDVLDGLLNKQKIRLRRYPPGNEFKLEYKRKSNSDSFKHSIAVTEAQAHRIASGYYDGLLEMDDAIAKEMYARLKCGYIPKFTVDYRRAAYRNHTGDISISFDTNISASPVRNALFDDKERFVPVLPQGVGVLEVKYSMVLYSVYKTMLERVDALSNSYSKYIEARLCF